MRNSLFFLLVVSSFAFLHQQVLADKKAYIVYLGSHSYGPEATVQDYELATESHYDLLGSYLGSKEQARSAILYSYRKNINGFAAMLDEEEALQIAKHPDVISVFPDRKMELHTTRSWYGLGLEGNDGKALPESIWSKANYGEDVIIGNLDTGVWPESKSFNDEGLGPVPARWKGFCQNNTKEGVPCNRKLIGARYFRVDPKSTRNITLSARDTAGHGSHTLSTASGSFVPGANIFGYANGTAKGGSPKARVAAYKVCWPEESCGGANILAAFDAAIHDGVDVLSLSMGAVASDYFTDPIAIGSFHAVQRGITVVCSAGNSGPSEETVSNVAPWIVTVAASTIDRSFPTDLVLGNGKHITGQSTATENLSKLYPLITALDAMIDSAEEIEALFCFAGSLDPKKVKGKIVVCLTGEISRVQKGVVVQSAGGVGMVLANDQAHGDELFADPHLLPAIMITYKDSLTLQSYINSTKSPTAYISKPKTNLGAKPAPKMASFSSRGPNIINPQILKPDITAPGVSVLAAYTGGNSPGMLPEDTRRVPYVLMSGTSMSCPHISGVVGLLKKLHPDWSPAAIRSAIMTTARTQDNSNSSIQDWDGRKATPFLYGAGHVSPNRAMDPGLVYDLTTSDYLDFLCAFGYDSTKLPRFGGKNYSCPAKPVKIEDLNYPSITVANLSKSATVRRTVKNVGAPGTYRVRVDSPKGVTVSVKPEVLKFDKVGEEKSFEVTLQDRNVRVTLGALFGGLTWSDGKHEVRIPLVANVFL